MSRSLKIILLCNLIAVAILAFVYPQLIVAPGKLIPGHQQLEGDCFACHAPLRGASAARCISCHKPAEIGRLNSKGLPIAKPISSTAFHQELKDVNCIDCHSDHAGVKRYHLQGNFNHALLKKATLDQCQSCHKSPKDALHQKITGNCISCHTPDKWTPASFDHDKYFVLDRDHNARCSTCHVNNDYSRYSCYGCHEHTQSNIRRKHIEEGIRKFDNCVECHRSADEDDIREGGGDGKRNGKSDDD